MNERADFERWRYCRSCGRRLIYSQVDRHDRVNGKVIGQELAKRCPLAALLSDAHDFVSIDVRYSGSKIVNVAGGWPG